MIGLLYHIQFALLLRILVCCQETFLQQRNFIWCKKLSWRRQTLFDADKLYPQQEISFFFFKSSGPRYYTSFWGKTIHYTKCSLTLWQHRASLPIIRTINWLSQPARIDRVCYLWQINVIFVATSSLGYLVIWLERQRRLIFKHSLTCHDASWAKKTTILPQRLCDTRYHHSYSYITLSNSEFPSHNF